MCVFVCRSARAIVQDTLGYMPAVEVITVITATIAAIIGL